MVEGDGCVVADLLAAIRVGVVECGGSTERGENLGRGIALSCRGDIGASP